MIAFLIRFSIVFFGFAFLAVIVIFGTLFISAAGCLCVPTLPVEITFAGIRRLIAFMVVVALFFAAADKDLREVTDK